MSGRGSLLTALFLRWLLANRDGVSNRQERIEHLILVIGAIGRLKIADVID